MYISFLIAAVTKPSVLSSLDWRIFSVRVFLDPRAYSRSQCVCNLKYLFEVDKWANSRKSQNVFTLDAFLSRYFASTYVSLIL